MSVTTQELEVLRSGLEKQAIELKAKLDQVQKHLDSVNTTLELLSQQGQQMGDLFHEPQHVVFANDLRGMTQLSALIKIAKANNNRLKLTTAKQLLLQAGLTTSKKNAMNIIFNVVKRSDQFEKIGPGVYQLKSDASPIVH